MGFENRNKAKRYSRQEGDTLRAIAERETAAGNPMTWQELALFNFGTDDPHTLDEYLRDELGCRKRGSDNHFVIAEDDDARGELVIPTAFKKNGLALQRTHKLRVRSKTSPPQFLDCATIPGITFAYNKSFVRPSVVDTIASVEAALAEHPDAKVMIFGHTDKVGSDQYNKALSERRSRSVFAFITDDVATWEELYHQEDWGIRVVQEILKDLGGEFDPGPVDGINGPKTQQAVKNYQAARGLTVDGVAGPKTRNKLFGEYMTGKHDIRLTPDRFMEPKHMGCGEFNPVVPTEEPHEPNRRVTFYLFDPRRLPNLPCRHGDLAPCLKQKSPAAPRFRESFGCSFYDSLDRQCAGGLTPTTKARLAVEVVDGSGAPLAGALVRVTGLGEKQTDSAGRADYGVVDAGTYTISAEKPHHAPSPDAAAGPVQVKETVPDGTDHLTQLTLHLLTAQCDFDLDIDLKDHSDGAILTPFRIPDHDEVGGGTHNQDHVRFEIEIEDNPVDRLEIEIYRDRGSGRETVWKGELPPELRAVGSHEWRWDGFGNNDILDTRVLKAPDLKLELRATLCDRQKVEILEFDNEAAEQDWLDVVIDRSAKNVTVHLRVDLKDGGDSGVGEMPPDEVWEQKSPVNWNAVIPAGDPRRRPHVRTRSFADLERLALDGVRTYWSRNAGNGLNIATPDGPYTVDVQPVNTTEDAMDDVDLEYNTNGDWGRSSNPGSIRGFFSFFANIFIPERSIFNAGWIEYDNGWSYIQAADEDRDFRHTAAHELGHEILSAYGGDTYSYSHRGSSTVITQKKEDLGDGGQSYPATGEIDLMIYYHGPRPPDFYTRSVACEVDVKSLIWLARVEFDD